MTKEAIVEIVLTIAIPTYNGAETLIETLESIVHQLQPGVDILISDNASTDGTAEIVKKYQAQFPQISYRRNPINLGADKNFDLAITNSRGNFVWLFSDDDYMESEAVESATRVLELYPKLGVVFVNYSVYTPENRCLDFNAAKIGEDRYFENGQVFLKAVNIGPIFCSSNIVRRSLWIKTEKQQFIGSNWIHYAGIFTAVRYHSAYILSKPYIRLISRAKWSKQGQYFKNMISLAKVINQLVSYGYSKPVTQSTLNVIAKNLIMTVVGAKIQEIEVKKAHFYGVLCEFFSVSPFKSILSVVLLSLPNHFYGIPYRIYKRIKSR